MNHVLFRIRVRPRGAWRTPWQADTLVGLLCWAAARTEGPEVLREQLIEPMLMNAPPFVLSDAFPGDLLPVPVTMRLVGWPVKDRRTVKRGRWLSLSAFDRARRGQRIEIGEFVPDSPVTEHGRGRNAIGRSTNTTAAPGSLFTLPEYRINPRHPALAGTDWLSVYVRVRPGCEDLLLALFADLAATGFGADASAGLGAFDFPGGSPTLEPVDALGEAPSTADSVLVLSTFQPGGADPVVGVWESFTKFGRLGPDFGLADVRKKPVLLFRPGACFVCDANRPFLGRAIPMDELLPLPTVRALEERGTLAIHPAFGLTVPATYPLT